MKKSLIYSILTLILLTACSQAGASSGQELTIREAWARPGAAGATSAVYFIIENGGETDTLLSAASGVAAANELHVSMMTGEGAMTMHHLENVPVPAGENVEFAPGGLHVMLIDLTEGLAPGDQFDLTLTFENAGEMTVPVTVREP